MPPQETERTDREVIRDLEVRLGKAETAVARLERSEADLTDRLYQAERERAEALAEVAAATRVRDGLADELCDLSGEILPLKSTIAKLEPIAIDAEERVRAARQDVDARVERADRARREAVKRADGLRDELARLRKVERTEETKDKLRRRIRDLEYRLRTASARNGELAQLASRAELDRARARELAAANDGLVRERADLQIVTIELRAKLADAQTAGVTE